MASRGKGAKSRTVDRLADLRPDPLNRRTRTARGAGMLADALRTVGPARSIVIDEEDTILAGNGVAEAAAAGGFTKVQVVEADGETVIAVRRRGLTPEQKRQLAMYDNRPGELGEWDAEQLLRDAAQGLSLQPFFNEAETRKLFKDASGSEPTVEEVQTDEVADRFWISVRGPLKAQAHALRRLRELMKEIDGVQVELGTIADELMPV